MESEQLTVEYFLSRFRLIVDPCFANNRWCHVWHALFTSYVPLRVEIEYMYFAKNTAMGGQYRMFTMYFSCRKLYKYEHSWQISWCKWSYKQVVVVITFDHDNKFVIVPFAPRFTVDVILSYNTGTQRNTDIWLIQTYKDCHLLKTWE